MATFKPWNKYERDLEILLGRFIYQKLKTLCWQHVLSLDAAVACSAEPVPFSEIGNLDFCSIQEGEVWARENFACGWFRLTGKLPANTDRSGLYLEFFNDGEGLLVDEEGNPVKGFTAGSIVFGVMDDSIEKRYYPLEDLIDGDGRIECWIDGASNSMLGEFRGEAKLEKAAVVRKNEMYLDLFYDFDTLYEYLRSIDWDDPNKLKVLYGLRSAENLINYQDPDFYGKAKQIFAELYALPGSETIRAAAIAHAHLDLAWLWPLRESKRKAKRTFANLIFLSKKYPAFRFVASQPQQLVWMKESEPMLYRELKALAKRGNLEPVGGGWVESDTNLPGEESLVRQMLYGQKFWKEEFGDYVRICWLPDAFGYSGALPQILKLSGQDYFLTIKISWSNRTVFPYNTFRWAGIDGTEVTVHMPPEGNYNSVAGPRALLTAKKGIKETDPQDRMMLVYGVGDGGGGPSVNSVERCLRTRDVRYLPHAEFGTAEQYFRSLEPENLPRYDGEMYLEKHRGTYTSQSNNKNYNREFEEKMLALETLLSCLGERGDTASIDRLWKEVLLYQFHDILPGSAISRVYAETTAAYGNILSELEGMAKRLGASFLPGGRLINPSGEEVFRIEPFGDTYLLYRGSERLISPISCAEAVPAAKVDSVETDHYRVTFAPDGSFDSLCLADGTPIARSANRLRVFIDLGDGWDFEDDYRDQREVYAELTDSTVRRFGALTEIRQRYSFRDSRIEQTILMHQNDPCIRITHDIHWDNIGYMLRAEFLPAHWSDTVRSDIQFGFLDRPTTDCTPHEKAQFEICCQKWFDLSDEAAGLSVLNNAKNGFMAKEGILSLNLLRSTDYPAIDGEVTPLHYSYALYPHEGGVDPLKTDKLAQQFASRPLYGECDAAMPTFDNEQIQITAFKPAYDGDGFVLRAFERTGQAAQAGLCLPEGWQLAGEVDLLEDPTGEGEERVLFRPFQIRSWRLHRTIQRRTT
ncbi:MAG: alpha-mannosidase [Oscillospiraceae bacterium]|nr:alpha-mannosidase [Oscillospiraceae bacterium]